MDNHDTRFVGTIPAIYDRHLGPVLFQVHADDLAGRVPFAPGMRILEVACGTGIVTRSLLERLPTDGQLVAVDLNAPMVDYARAALPTDSRFELRTADAQALPFPDATFDAYVCQFGVMFFPDKASALREMKRVLKPGGELLVNVWRPLIDNRFAHVVQQLILKRFPLDPPRFYEAPFSWGDPATILAALEVAGLRDATCEPLQRVSEPVSPAHFARGLVLGNPLALELSERGVDDPEELISGVAEAIATECGAASCRVVMNTVVVHARV